MTVRSPTFLALVALVAVPSRPAQGGPRAGAAGQPPCPQPSERRGAVCVLLEDAVLDHTLVVPSGVHLDCAGRRLSPGSPAPTLAILVHDASRVKITACRIEGFEQGIYLVRSPTPAAALADPDALERARNRISGNKLDVRLKGITLWGAEDAQIDGNTVRYASNFGYGIGVWRGSHRNLVRGNRIEGVAGPAGETAPDDFPGEYLGYQANGPAFLGAGIYVAASGADTALVQFQIGDELFQFGNDALLRGVEDNVIEANRIAVASTAVPSAIRLASRNQRTVLRGNVVAGASVLANGITVGAGNLTTVNTPSRCTRDPARLCLRDVDCTRLGDPAETCDTAGRACFALLEGECLWGTPIPNGDYRSHDVLVADNQIGPGFAVGIDDSALAGRITGNRVSGATVAGIRLGGAAIDGKIVDGNVLAGNRVGLALGANRPSPGAAITRNDVTGSIVRPLAAPLGWAAPLAMPGNHWGRACPDAFRPLPPAPRTCTLDAARACLDDASCAGRGVCGTADAEAPNDFLFDPTPYGEPVAATPPGTTLPCE